VESIAELRRICQADKLRHSRGLTRLNRSVSIYGTFVALAIGLSANTLTAISIAAGLGSAILLALPDYPANVGGLASLYLSFFLDQVDGEVARYHRRPTLAGTYLDELRHILIYAAPVFGLSMRLVAAHPTPLLAGAGFAAAISLIILRFNANAAQFLFTKKVLIGVHGLIELHASDPRSGSKARVRNGSRRRRAPGAVSKAIGAVAYVTTNQVGLLLSILAYVHILRLIDNQALHEDLFLMYTGAVVGLALLGIWKLAYRGQIVKGCLDIQRSLEERQ
jgi:phosphatidylglycerophosphate synthase